MSERMKLSLAHLFGPDAEHLVAAGPAEHADQPDPADERWEALAAGTLSQQDELAFRALASATPRGRSALAALTPLSDAARDRMAAAITRELAEQEPAEQEPPSSIAASPDSRVRLVSPQAASAAATEPPREGGQHDERRAVTATAARRARWLGMWLGPLLAAALLLLWFGLAREPAALPKYAIDVAEAGSRTMRSDTRRSQGEPLRVRRDAGEPFQLVLRPRVSVQGPVEVRAFLVRDGRAQPWQFPIERSESGAFRIIGGVDQLLAIEEGSWLLAMVVGRPGDLPDEAQLLTALASGPRGEWQLLAQRLVVERGAR